MSGAPLTRLAREKVAELRAALGPEMPLIGVGGIVDAQSAEAMFAAGADLIQIYSGFIYSGPPLIQDVLTGGHPGSG